MGSRKTPMLLDTFNEDMQKQILEKHLPPYMWSPQKISSWLKEVTGKQASHMSVRKWLERRSASVTASIYGSKEFKDVTNKLYGEVLGEYFVCLKRLMMLEKEVCMTKQLDIMAKTKCATDLFTVIKEGTMAAKDMIVGEGGSDKHVLDLDSELERIEQDHPIVRIKPLN